MTAVHGPRADSPVVAFLRDRWRLLVGCLFGGFVLSLMYGNHEGSQTDIGAGYYAAVEHYRYLWFLGLGLLVFLAVVFSSYLGSHVLRPGISMLLFGVLSLVAAYGLLNWWDPNAQAQANTKFSGLRDLVSQTSGFDSLASAFFSWLGYVSFAVVALVALAAVVLHNRWIGYLCAVLALLSGYTAYHAHQSALDFANAHAQGSVVIDHSLGMFAAVIGYVLIAVACLLAGHSRLADVRPGAEINTLLAWRLGFVPAVLATALGLLAFSRNAWFAPNDLDADLSQTYDFFKGKGLGTLAFNYLADLGWILFAITAVVALAATLLRNLWLGLAATALGVLGVVLTFLTLHDITTTNAHAATQSYGKTWQNLGNGGWCAAIAFMTFAGAGLAVALATRTPKTARGAATGTASMLAAKVRSSASSKMYLVIGLGLILFYPPTLGATWQNLIVSQIAVYVLLAVGLNVVVGWAGLLDLGYIAFYGVGCYTTAYFTGSLPVKPPSWLQFSPLWAIPIAMVICIIAGVLLGAPTLRLRGDYLAIVTLGFGEIVQRIAQNNPGDFTAGASGPRNIPHPVFHLGSFKITWGTASGEDNLPYWYLLVIITVIIVVAMYRVEGSRIGRAWAAIREDEVAAQATGINTTRIKLLAFAIGASTSGAAGAFFASQNSSFDPTLFTLQISILIVAYVVFGGMGSLVGAMAGAAALTWLPQFLRSQLPLEDNQMWIGALLLLMMIFRPAGLFPAKRRKAELEGLHGGDSAEVAAVPASEGL